ncbi:PUA-like domain-containing protein [Microdochium bolleyi]|uniref:Thymocyte nuclear protein 1 n=1 Tax=Microdochium bolleyi TaxID=196109 RepID=A0A136IYJ1_9PEZI|nr:PUA-like domain-containing protein [Microdochium bolleyi]
MVATPTLHVAILYYQKTCCRALSRPKLHHAQSAILPVWLPRQAPSRNCLAGIASGTPAQHGPASRQCKHRQSLERKVTTFGTQLSIGNIIGVAALLSDPATMPKRKQTGEHKESSPAPALRRSARAKPPAPPASSPAPAAAVKQVKQKTAAKVKNAGEAPAKKAPAARKTSHGSKTTDTGDKVSAAAKQAPSSTATGTKAEDGERWYWLMKAEPETRLENGTDVRFSIDDLKAKTEPEPWDGIRNYVARNNLRAMKKGELAFFYHSNCKEPGIVGTMEIVQEHSPDLSAHDFKAPYYDPKSKPEDPKWSVVHVRFHSKFAKQIGLQELRGMGKPGSPLENMQMLKQSRLSVSRVSPDEWEYLMSVVRERGGETS